MSASRRQPLRIWELLAALANGGVEFLVIGGVAVGVHGFERATKDIDIVPSPDADNIKRLFAVLAGLEAEPIDLQELHVRELPVPFSAGALAQGGNWFLATRHGRVDVMQFIDGILEGSDDYRALDARALPLETPVGTVRFAGYEDLLRMKYAAGRDQDLVDVRALREARGDLG